MFQAPLSDKTLFLKFCCLGLMSNVGLEMFLQRVLTSISWRRYLCVGMLFISLCGCGQMKGYVLDQPDSDQITQDFDTRDITRESVDVFAAKLGYNRPWPPEKWGLEELMYTALYFSPRLKVARQNKELFEVSAQLSGLEIQKKVQVATEYHTNEVNGEKPWGLGFTVGLPFFSEKKQKVLSEKSLLYVDDATLKLTQEIWLLHSELRNNLFRWNANAAKRKLNIQKIKLARELIDLVEARFSYGFANRDQLNKRKYDLGLFLEQELMLETERLEIVSTMAGFIGMPAIDLEQLVMSHLTFDETPDISGVEVYRSAALLNRIDLQESLVDFGLADVELKLALIKQYPEISISPGYFWDQGDKIWNFALGLALPKQSDVLILQAENVRNLKHLEVKETQINILSQVEGYHAMAQSARARLVQSRSNLRQANEIFAGAEERFGVGNISRVDLYDGRLAYIAIAEQFIDQMSDYFTALAALEDSCQTPLLFQYKVLASMNYQLKDPLE